MGARVLAESLKQNTALTHLNLECMLKLVCGCWNVADFIHLKFYVFV